jgi:hypothetical protein
MVRGKEAEISSATSVSSVVQTLHKHRARIAFHSHGSVLLPHPPKRTHSKPRKGCSKASRENHPPESLRLTSLILGILTKSGDSPNHSQHEKCEPRNFQPKLMRHPANGSPCGPCAAKKGRGRAGVPNLPR